MLFVCLFVCLWLWCWCFTSREDGGSREQHCSAVRLTGKCSALTCKEFVVPQDWCCSICGNVDICIRIMTT